MVKVTPTRDGFKMYGREWNVRGTRHDLTPEQRSDLIARLHKATEFMYDIHTLCTFEREAISTLQASKHSLAGVTEMEQDKPVSHENPFMQEPSPVGHFNGVTKTPPARTAVISTENGTVCIIKNNGGVHNMFSNAPFDMFTYSRLLSMLPVNWCWALELTVPLWEHHGFVRQPWKEEHGKHVLLVRVNNVGSKAGKRVSDRLWDRMLRALPEHGCEQWQLTK